MMETEQAPDEVNPDTSDLIQLRDAYQLRSQVNVALRADLAAAAGRLHEWRQEMNWLGQRILEEAQERDWCAAYDEWVGEVNRHNILCTLPVRVQEMETSFVVTFSGLVPMGGEDWEETLQSVLRSLHDHSEAEWIDNWDVSWSRR